MMNELVKQACDIAGGQTALARRCGKKQGHVWNWLHSDQVSAEAAVLIDAATDGVVPKEQLRPDLFGKRGQAA